MQYIHYTYIYICICTPGSARPAPGRKFGKLEWLEEINCLWSVEVVRCMNEWANGCWDANDMTWHERIRAQVSERTNEPMNRWNNESMNQSVNESMNQWSNEAMTQWIKRPVNQWIDQSVKQRLNESMVQQVSESMNHWISEPRNQWINEWKKLANLIFQRCSNPLSFFAVRAPKRWKQRPETLATREIVRGWTATRRNLMDGSHDDVVDMMMQMQTMTIVRDPEVC